MRLALFIVCGAYLVVSLAVSIGVGWVATAYVPWLGGAVPGVCTFVLAVAGMMHWLSKPMR
ncbi:hypothetical protein [Tranquillimonas rosea]|uniref:hypothetical protein n=1 Tax=Tranquillimonas rosea TaxID=641238 RepID=UPI003BACF669